MKTDPESHQRMTERRREGHEKKQASATVEKGLLIVNTGTGKGKTTAAFGMAVRVLGHGMRLGVVTNCSEQLGRIAARRVGIDFDVVVTAEGAGAYKPHPRTYTLALAELGVAPERCLFVAGSAYDLIGTAAVGLATYWHDRMGMVAPDGALPLLAHHSSLQALPEIALG